MEQKRGPQLLGCFGLLEQAVHSLPGKELVARFHVVAGSDLERGEEACDFGCGHLFQQDGGGFLNGGEFVFDGDAHGWFTAFNDKRRGGAGRDRRGQSEPRLRSRKERGSLPREFASRSWCQKVFSIRAGEDLRQGWKWL